MAALSRALRGAVTQALRSDSKGGPVGRSKAGSYGCQDRADDSSLEGIEGGDRRISREMRGVS